MLIDKSHLFNNCFELLLCFFVHLVHPFYQIQLGIKLDNFVFRWLIQKNAS